MDQQPSGREDYVRKVLEAYRNTPGTCGNLRRPDRLLAVQLCQRGVPLHQVENALVLADEWIDLGIEHPPLTVQIARPGGTRWTGTRYFQGL
jgi:hypothetical protein